MTGQILKCAIAACSKAECFFFKFLSANDTGLTGGHQVGVYLPKEVGRSLLGRREAKNKNEKNEFVVHWWDGSTDTSTLTWYGKSKDEFRITRGFSRIKDENAGDLFVFSVNADRSLSVFLITSDEDVESFLEAFALSTTDALKLISGESVEDTSECIPKNILKFVKIFDYEFPDTKAMCDAARKIHTACVDPGQRRPSDAKLISWIETEYSLFRAIEKERYKDYYVSPLGSIDRLVEVANTILNRRKSRAGHSLENHFENILLGRGIRYSAQKETEKGHTPDFIFPGIAEYRDARYSENKLVSLALKTTCRERWNQILNEAKRTKQKHLLTLQAGLPETQFEKMWEAGVRLVVPKSLHKEFPVGVRSRILTVDGFLATVESKAG